MHHHPDCDWHTDQYPWECTCGTELPRAKEGQMTNGGAIDSDRRLIELESKSEVRRALETAAKAVEGLAGTRHYQAAWRKAARIIRALKPD